VIVVGKDLRAMALLANSRTAPVTTSTAKFLSFTVGPPWLAAAWFHPRL